jgi:hypothetical protein
MVKKPNQLPQRNWTDGAYTAIWIDGEVLREVRAGSMRESWTQYDPELIEREFLPKEKRRELRTVSAALPSPPAVRPSQTPPPRREPEPQPRNPDSGR